MSYSAMESEEQERKLFVGGLNKTNTDEESLRGFFIKFGGIIDCTIMRDADKQSRGFGFVLFESASSVDEIITVRKEGKNFTLDDHHIEVKRALPKVPGGTAGSSRTGGLYRKIFVGGLPSTINDDELRKYFERFGRVTETELLRDRETNRLRGFAFVTFDDEDSADKCIQRRTHEICKKLCEVKRAQTRSNINKYEDDDHRGGGGRFGGSRDRDERHHHPGPQAPSSLGINEVNQLIQQAFVMGQQSVMNTGIQPPTAASLLGQLNPAPYAQQAAANPLLQALMNQHAAPAQPVPVPAPITQHAIQQPAAAAAAGNTNLALANQIAQLLQGRPGGIDPTSALNALMKQDDSRQPQAAKPATNGAYSTTYPTSSTYDMYYNQSNTNTNTGNYGPAKDDADSKRYRPY